MSLSKQTKKNEPIWALFRRPLFLSAALIFMASTLCKGETAAEWFESARVREDILDHDLRHIRAESYESMTTAEKEKIRKRLESLKERLSILNQEILDTKNKRFSEGAPDDWMGRIQIIQDLQLSNELARRDLRRTLFSKNK